MSVAGREGRAVCRCPGGFGSDHLPGCEVVAALAADMRRRAAARPADDGPAGDEA